ncbi:MAG: hypothetical protein VYE73_01790 [Acidobacteriota bacterium]|nr:hypothetical protein [Acidobacteriota bacterium]
MPNSKFRGHVALLACLALLLCAPALLAQKRWFHVRVSEGGSDPVEVSVNFPLTLIEKAIGLIPAEVDE